MTLARDSMDEITFLVEEAEDGGYIAHAVNESIFTDADDLLALHLSVREAVRCHFDEGAGPKRIRLQFVREEIIAA
jgi:hypothetical protein